MLLTRLEPDGHPVDGAGGDGGVDYLVRTAAGERIYQAKGFTGRLTPARRKQIQHSLDAVAGRRIEDWSMVVPINPTPGESAWLATELARRGIVGRWLGLDWLNARLASHADLLNVLLGNRGSQRLQAQETLRAVAIDIANPNDVAASQASLAAVADGLSPFIRMLPQSTAEGVRIHLEPKPGSPCDPLVMSLECLRPHVTDDVIEAIQLGKSAVFEAPVTVTNIPPQLFGEGSLTFSMIERAGPRVDVTWQACTRSGAVVGELALPTVSSTIGAGGTEIRAVDRSRWITVLVRVRADFRRIDVTYEVNTAIAAAPADLLALSAFVEALIDGGLMRFELRIDDCIAPTTLSPAPTNLGPLQPNWFVDFVSDMHAIQRHTGVSGLIGSDTDAEDVELAREVAALIRGEAVVRHGEFQVTFIRVPDSALEYFMNSVGVYFEVTSEEPAYEIAGTTYRFGATRRRFRAEGCIITNLDEVQAAHTAGSGVVARFEIGSNGALIEHEAITLT
jgi:hypothetical protein